MKQPLNLDILYSSGTVGTGTHDTGTGSRMYSSPSPPPTLVPGAEGLFIAGGGVAELLAGGVQPGSPAALLSLTHIQIINISPVRIHNNIICHSGLRIRSIFGRIRIQQIRILKTGSGSYWHLPRIN